jgi:hypothetical protein
MQDNFSRAFATISHLSFSTKIAMFGLLVFFSFGFPVYLGALASLMVFSGFHFFIFFFLL